MSRLFIPWAAAAAAFAFLPSLVDAHGTVVSPTSRVYRVYRSNPQNPSFQLARNAVQIDGTLSYYTWNEVSRNIPAAVQAGLPPGFDYSPWIPDGQLASAGRVDPASPLYPRTYAGLDQVSPDWPTTPVAAGRTITVDFLATAPHNPSVWDVWMTTADWDASTPLRWSHMEFLGRPNVTFASGHYTFDLTIPGDRSGHHVLWVAWQRDDPVGEVFCSTSDLDIRPANDDCAGARPVQDGRNGTFSTTAATPSVPTPSCVGGGLPDVWFEYTATCTGTLRVDTCASAPAADTVVSVFAGACNAPAQLACVDDSCGTRASALAAVVQGQRYLLRVGTRGPPREFELAVSYANGTGSFTRSSTGCGAATLRATGSPNVGGLVDFDVSGPGAVQWSWLGARQAATPVCAGCRLGTTPDIALPGRISLLIPCDASLVGVSFYAQGADLAGSTGGCALAGGLSLTETLRTTIGG